MLAGEVPMESKPDPIPDPKTWKFSLTQDEIRAYYAKAKAEFSEDDLRLFFTEEEGVPFEELLAELDQMAAEKRPGAPE
jgi:hypothetical protein